METLNINISHIKNIKKAELEVPFDNGIYTFVGANGCGKSSLMLYASTFPHCSMKSSEYLWPKTKRLVKDERRSKSKLRVCA